MCQFDLARSKSSLTHTTSPHLCTVTKKAAGCADPFVVRVFSSKHGAIFRKEFNVIVTRSQKEKT